MFEATRKWHQQQRLEKVAGNLTKRGFQVQVIDQAAAIVQAVLDLVDPFDTVGVGGSVTVRELGLISALSGKLGRTQPDHWQAGLSPEEIAAIVRQHPASDCFISSCNAVTLDGQLVNIDGTGNRVVSLIYGPKRVVAIIGYQKIASDLDSALARIREEACPQNSKRRESGRPCEKAGHCVDCQDNKSMCMVTTIIQHRPPTIDFHIILTPLELGF